MEYAFPFAGPTKSCAFFFLSGWSVEQMFEMAHGTEQWAVCTSLAVVFFSHSHQCLSWRVLSPACSGLKGKHLQFCRDVVQY